jgi:hypothetical protein
MIISVILICVAVLITIISVIIIKNSINSKNLNQSESFRPFYEIGNPIDMVYTWVDGKDKDWLETKNKYASPESPYSNTADRFDDNEELRYSLRSVEKYAPWIRTIYIITYNGNKPSWLNDKHPKIRLISHSDIFPDKSHLPTFNSQSIECHFNNIPSLSEYFIYSNDDMMFGNHVNKMDFILPNGKLAFGKGNTDIASGEYTKGEKAFYASWKNNSFILDSMFGKKSRMETMHQISITSKHSMNILSQLQDTFFENTSKSKFRDTNNIAPIGLSQQFLLETGNGELCNISNKAIFLSNNIKKNNEEYTRALIERPKFLCVNDDIYSDREIVTKDLRKFLNTYYPDFSMFEL